MAFLEKLKEVTRLLGILSSDLEKVNLLPHRKHDAQSDTEEQAMTEAERDACLEQLKVYGRDPNYSDPIFTKEARFTSQFCILKC